MTDEKRIVYWYDCDCDWISKYCDENHRRSALVELDYLRAAAAAHPTIHAVRRVE